MNEENFPKFPTEMDFFLSLTYKESKMCTWSLFRCSKNYPITPNNFCREVIFRFYSNF